ncbi:MAG: SDR family NAD(P)-dependent oxidoreductase, partial [Lachnospiraceae bacterium]|nr:SDR family NAD(P)-dependent oxidoreductase [Lachnospiraceae bacterium]
LVNCAGTGSYKPFSEQSRREIEAMLRVNILVLTRMTSICLPYLKKGSRLLQIASGAAFVPQENFAVYAASKAYVYSFSRALTQELRERGVQVTTVCPGPVDTPFLDRAYGDASELNLLKKLTIVEPACVVKKAIDDCRRGKKVSVCGLPMKFLYLATQGIANLSLL